MATFRSSFRTSQRIILWLAALSFLTVTQHLGATAANPAATLSGQATVVDGDTLDIAGERIRLEGVDAPEISQTCNTSDGAPWACGREAQRALSRLVDKQTVMCDRKGADKYGRTLAVCYVEGEDINALLVRTGMARAFVKYSTLNVAQEVEAQAAKLGLWQGEHVAPWDYRHNRWQTAEVSAPAGCAIKGNVSSRGKIYHVPWGTWYDKVKVDEGHGERWFCSEAEAQAAGWRPAQQL